MPFAEPEKDEVTSLVLGYMVACKELVKPVVAEFVLTCVPDTERECVLERVVVCEGLDIFEVTELVLNCVLCVELRVCDITKLVLGCVTCTELEGECAATPFARKNLLTGVDEAWLERLAFEKRFSYRRYYVTYLLCTHVPIPVINRSLPSATNQNTIDLRQWEIR